jgi:hypothetical protein
MTRLPRPPSMDERVFPVVDDQWRTALAIYAVFGEEGPHATRQALSRLAGAGRIERRYDPLGTGFICRYRKLQAKP